MLYSPGELPMSSVTGFLNDNAIGIALQLLILLVVAALASRAVRALCNRLVRPASGSSKAEQAREQQTRTLAELTFKSGSAVVWLVAALTALALLGISPLPAIAVMVVAGIAAGLGAQNLLRDVLAGFQILLEDQFAVGETVQIGESSGRVEQLTLRRTVLRDVRGALVTIANGEIRTVANLSRDWSQALVDVALAPEMPLEKPLSALESAAAELRADAAWSPALVDGPRVLGVQAYDRNASVVRLQMRTLPMRQEEIARELRRRIQLEFQKQGIPVASVQRLEMTNTQAAGEAPIPSTLSRQ
jgi:moderate conductance mechanosensitive channel